MEEILALLMSFLGLMGGALLGYLARQSIAKRQAGTIEAELQKKVDKAKIQVQSLLDQAQKKADRALDLAKREEARRRGEIFRTEGFLRKKEANLEEKTQFLERKERAIKERVQELRGAKETIIGLKQEAEERLEKIANLSKSEAKKEFFDRIEKDSQKEILERMRKLETVGQERYEKRAKEILAQVIQRCALSQAQEITTTTVALPNEDIKGRIIGKEGRNIRTLERSTGTEITIDETPGVVVISGFSPIRRQIAKIALEKLVRDGRIQPARIEEEVEKAEEELVARIKEAGEQATFETGVLDLDPKLVQLLGRLSLRTSYGQNVLLHSIEVAHLAAALAAEIGADVEICKKAGLLHDIGKALDHQIEGSHIEIGIRVLEKFSTALEIVEAMKAHHEDYPAKSLEAVIVKVADQISGARPGARKESLEEYLKRLENLERITLRFEGIEKAYAIQAGRELRVFVNAEEVDDLQAQKLAKNIASSIQEELKYPGEIKVTLIREKRIIEYAK